MNPQQARALVSETFSRPFDKDRFRNFAINLLHHVDESKAQAWNTTYIKAAFKGHVKGYQRLGTYTSPENDKLDVLIVYLTSGSKLERARTAIRNFVAHHLKTRDNKDAALVAFVSPAERQWRFSYVTMEYAAVARDDGKVGMQTTLTPARRSSYIVGEGESCHTAQSRFLHLLEDSENQPTLTQIDNAFSVEAVTKEFFEQYKELFLDLKDELDDLAKKDKSIAAEFTAKSVNTGDFAKKLMGQIVFLFFLQKKGWLGVPRGSEWGDGPHNFLRRLYEGQFRAHKNFFNDILEPLFYDTLATDRGHEAWCKTFSSRIPFLNGGLFEPLREYDWRNTDIVIPNRLFSNTKTTAAGDTGTGILDVFDRYNFTVNEAEPLEREVAIDPEMLGKVFENLLEVKERKSKGSFYTPREIVHYMCQQSLISYLESAVNTSEESLAASDPSQTKLFTELEWEQTVLTAVGRRVLVPRYDIETFIHSGDQASYYEAARVEGASYRRNLPKSIETHARLLDDKLANITVCDPAIGSGAFPVGMMQEIVRARSALTPYFNDVHDRTAYQFKRHAIQSSLYGVDIDPGAVDIAKLRLWLSLVVDEDDVKQIKPLPNLEYKVVRGNSLVWVEKNLFNADLFTRLEELKPRYFDATDRRQKEKFKLEIDKLIHELTNGNEAFDFEIYFSEVFHRTPGFDVLIGNPPYGVVTDENAKAYYVANYASAEGRFDTFELFIERSVRLGKTVGGKTMFIVPSPILTNVYSRKLRRFLMQETSLTEITNFGMDVFADPTVHTCILGTSRPLTTNNLVPIRMQVANVRELKCDFDYSVLQSELAQGEHSTFDIFLTPAARGLVNKLAKMSSPLADICHIRQCIKTGDDDKYVKTSLKRPGLDWKPSLRGRSIDRYCTREKTLWIKYGNWLARNWQNRSFYEVEKIAVRETGARITATLDTENRFFLSSLYSVYPIDTRNSHSLKYFLAIINSTLATWFVHLVAFGLTQGAFTKIRTNQFGRLPIRLINFSKPTERAQHDAIVTVVERILAVKQQNDSADVGALELDIDDMVYALYGLTREERTLVESMAT